MAVHFWITNTFGVNKRLFRRFGGIRPEEGCVVDTSKNHNKKGCNQQKFNINSLNCLIFFNAVINTTIN